jgi:fucose 4-O-acetylase-like acetyltransferase
MADIGDSSMAGTAHKHKTTSWITVGLIVIASVLLGFAMVFQSIPLAVVGVVLGLAGAGFGISGRILDDAH